MAGAATALVKCTVPRPKRALTFAAASGTKPAGEGTGLGLSLAYDIVLQGYSSTLEVES